MTGVPLVSAWPAAVGPWVTAVPAPWELQHVWRDTETGGGGGQMWSAGKGTGTLLGELKECFLEEAADEVHWN